jgi:catechol 2,3-dioxygenase-like lactoylglutathione lyase family enzyme
MLKRVTNVMYWVGDLEQSVEFYLLVGFELHQKGESRARVGLGDFHIELMPPQPHDTAYGRDVMSQARGEGAYLYVEVEDVNALYQELTSKGLVPGGQPSDWPWGNRELVVHDPNGYKLCFWQYI